VSWREWRVILGAGALALGALGCLEVPGTVCDDGRVCPSGMVCAPHGCALPQQLEACADKEPGEPCTYAGIQGTCIDGLCISSGCGNGVRDEGEACDDGRRCADGTPCQGTCGDGSNCQPRGGHGCSRDCLKVEECGDGFLDESEACDDGNDNPGDGCDRCALTQWVAQAVLGGGASAASTDLYFPYSIAADGHDNLFVADHGNHRVRRIEARTGLITTVAGTGGMGAYSGDGSFAASAQLNAPSAVAVDGRGNVFISDQRNHRVRRVDAATGIIATVAGVGTAGYGGDGSHALNAQLNNPSGVAVDGLGNVYISDRDNHRVRRIDGETGILTTVAGTGIAGLSGDGALATDAQLRSPEGLALQGVAYLFIADRENHRVRRLDLASGLITSVPTGSVLNMPHDIAINHDGQLVVSDAYNHQVRRIDAGTGAVTTVAGDGVQGFSGDGGPATSGRLRFPGGVAIDSVGNLYIADVSNHRIRRVASATSVITTTAGTGAAGYLGDGGAATSAQLPFPFGLAFHPSGLFVASSNRVRRIEWSTGNIHTIAGTGTAGYGGDGGPATAALLNSPLGLALDADGNLYIACMLSHRVRRVDAATGVISTVAGTGTLGFSGDGGSAVDAQLARPYALCVTAARDLLIADTFNDRVRIVDSATGIIGTLAGSGSQGFSGDGGPATEAELSRPAGVAVATDGSVLIADTGNRRIRRVDPVSGTISTIAGTGEEAFGGDGGSAVNAHLSAHAVAVDLDGHVYIADIDNHRVRRIEHGTGTITTIAGTGGTAFTGDGANATESDVTSPIGVAVDLLANVYISEIYDHRIRRVDATSGVITTIGGSLDPEGMGLGGQARLADPRAMVTGPVMTLVAGGTANTVQAFRVGSGALEVVAGRYPHEVATADLARFRDSSFGTVSGIAYDASAGLIYLTESSANRIHVVTVVDPGDKHTWTIATLANDEGTAGFANGPAAPARFRNPTGLYLDEAAQILYVTDTGNHVLRAIDLSNGLSSATVTTVAGTPATLGFFGDYGPAASALLFQPQAVTRCANGDIFLADTGNHRVRRIEPDGTITTVLGDGTAASSGEGSPAITFPVNAPLGLACDPFGNLLVTSTNAVRLVASDDDGFVNGTGPVTTIYGAAPRDTFPASVTRCLTGLAVVDATTVQVTDSCTGILIELRREPAP
jgi:cysteine-rich repeat protein